MDKKVDISNEGIEELVKKAKYVQNKIRRDLLLLSNANGHELQQIKDKLNCKRYKSCVREPRKKDDKKNDIECQTTVSAKRLTKSSTIGVQVALNDQISMASIKKPNPRATSSALSLNKRSQIQNSLSKLDIGDKRSRMSTTSSQRLPLQRFADKVTENIEFSQEHPNLELDTSSNQTTLFPRRLHKGHRLNRQTSAKKESVNLASAKLKIKDDSAKVMKDTWKHIMEKNSKQKKRKKVDTIKECSKLLSPIHEPPEPNDKLSNNFDVILTRPNKLFHLENQAERSAKQSNFNLQRLPVIYIKPECRIQKVVNISIERVGDSKFANAAGEQFSANTKYIECKHEDNNVAIDNHPTEVAPEKTTEQEAERTSNKMSRFYKAWDFTELSMYAPAKRDVSASASSSSSKSFTSVSYDSSCSTALKFRRSTSQHSATSDFSVENIIEDILSSSDVYREQVVNVRHIPIRREKSVQTDLEYKICNSPVFPSSCERLHHTVDVSCQTTQPKEEIQLEDDLIAKIFERVHNDIPSALQAFKERNNTTLEAVPSQSLMHKQILEEMVQKVSVASLLIDEKRHVSREQSPVESPSILQSDIAEDVEGGFLRLQQYPCLIHSAKSVPTIRSSALRTVAVKENQEKYCNQNYIKRAVKILLDSIVLGENEISNKEVLITEDTFITQISSTSYSGDSDSSSSRIVFSDAPKWSTPSSSFSGSEQEIGVTEESTKSNSMLNSLSDGEVRSIGEV